VRFGVALFLVALAFGLARLLVRFGLALFLVALAFGAALLFLAVFLVLTDLFAIFIPPILDFVLTNSFVIFNCS
jgi:hypothetical protein